MPTVRGGVLSPARYYPYRLLRLYGPVWAAILFAVVVRSLVPHEAVPGASWWLNAHQEAVSPWQLQHDGTLVFGTGGFAATSVLWSLRWEVLFSLFLPVFLLIGKRTRGMPWAVAGVAFAVLALSGGHDSPRYMPAFLLGSLMAFEIDRLRALGARLAAPTVGNRAVKALLVAVCIVSMTAVWWVRPDSPVVEHGLRAVVAAGACIAVGLPLVLGSLRSFLDTPVMQWAGSRSFSLYLVHEPIVVAAAVRARRHDERRAPRRGRHARGTARGGGLLPRRRAAGAPLVARVRAVGRGAGQRAVCGVPQVALPGQRLSTCTRGARLGSAGQRSESSTEEESFVRDTSRSRPDGLAVWTRSYRPVGALARVTPISWPSTRAL